MKAIVKGLGMMALCYALVLSVSLACMFYTPQKAYAMDTPPNATKVVKYKDGNYYALYKGKVAAFHKVKKHAKSITIPKYIKVKGKKYKVIAIHELQLWERVDVKKVTVKADNLETIEEPTLYKSWRSQFHVKLKVKITDKDTRDWLNAPFKWKNRWHI